MNEESEADTENPLSKTIKKTSIATQAAGSFGKTFTLQRGTNNVFISVILATKY